MSILPRLPEVYDEIRDTYLKYDYPWVIGYSGGKDSTTALQLVWYALKELPKEKLTKPVYVISTDTLVETPVIVDYTSKTIDLINEAAIADGLPITAQKLSPILNDTFWVNLLGRGYPAPNNAFRWCTERLKINPSNKFILEKVAQHGEVILVLGVRRGESATRDQVMNAHRFAGHKLARHSKLPGAWVYMPIENFSVDDVWTYLLQLKSPWGSDNLQLSALYKSAQDGECPLVVDTMTQSCGNSRFGCWVCTVVTKDKSMEAMIDSGEEWMIPLLEYRDWLSSTQDPELKPQQRNYRGRDGRIRISDDGRLLYRTYTLDFSREMLERLLKAQKEIQYHDPNFVILSEAELREIRRLWMAERQDWEDSVPGIYTKVTGKSLNWEQNDAYVPGEVEADILRELSETYDVPMQLAQKLIDAEWQNYGMRRRTSIHKAIDKIMREDWRTLDEVQAEAQRRQLNGKDVDVETLA
jgi:DNA sulfur modification protein DndC